MAWTAIEKHGALARTRNNAAVEKSGDPEPSELHERPNESNAEEYPASRDVIDDETDDDGRTGVQKEECRSGGKLKIGHDEYARKTDLSCRRNSQACRGKEDR